MASTTGTTSYSFSHDPGFYKYEGNLAMSSHTPARALDAVKTLTLTEQDLLVISYPKCGKFEMLINLTAKSQFSSFIELF